MPRRWTRTPNSCACCTPTRIYSSPDNNTASAITRFRASVIMSVTIRESTPFCCPAVLTNPRRTLTPALNASATCWGVGPVEVPSYQYIRSNGSALTRQANSSKAASALSKSTVTSPRGVFFPVKRLDPCAKKYPASTKTATRSINLINKGSRRSPLDKRFRFKV